jgi:hypothetical protein
MKGKKQVENQRRSWEGSIATDISVDKVGKSKHNKKFVVF